MCMKYKDYTDKIKAYCNDCNLSFSKLNSMIKGSGENDLIFQAFDSEKGSQGLLDETPMPVVLKITRKNGELIFEQTEHTRKYLS